MPCNPCRAGIAALLFAVVLGACRTVPVPPPEPSPVPVAPPAPAAPPSLPAQFVPSNWPLVAGWDRDRLTDAWPAFRIGCTALVATPATMPVWARPCAAAEAVDGSSDAAVRAYFEANFSPYEVRTADGRAEGLVTGYYEPLLAGSRTRTARYTVPLRGVPDDLLTVDLGTLYPALKDQRVRGRVDGRRVVPYWPRADIDAGTAGANGAPIAWVEDPVEAFFLQIQGSGRIELPDRTVMRVGYADQNGHPYRSIGRLLVDRGELPLERASMQGIREWGRRNPAKLPGLLNENPSYVFFREVPAPAPGTLAAAIDGPLGSLGVPLLRERTIAVDPRSIPLGAPVFLATTMPLSDRPLQRLTLAQDTGGAIRGAVRADFFWGFGDGAGREAGRMRQQGRMWLIWPRELPPPATREPGTP